MRTAKFHKINDSDINICILIDEICSNLLIIWVFANGNAAFSIPFCDSEARFLGFDNGKVKFSRINTQLEKITI
jgi:hypothetical protein